MSVYRALAVMMMGASVVLGASLTDDFARANTDYSSNGAVMGAGWRNSAPDVAGATWRINASELQCDSAPNRTAVLYNEEIMLDTKFFFSADVLLKGAYGGVVFNYQNPTNYYAARIRSYGNLYQIIKCVDGKISAVLSDQTTTQDLHADQYYTLRISADLHGAISLEITEAGSRTVLNTVTEAVDSTFAGGYAGFYCLQAGGRTPAGRYDHFNVQTFPEPGSEGRLDDGAQKPNVLFIAIDDLRPELNCYGAHQIKSPNIDTLANNGIRFDRAYTQFAICSVSRTTLLTGVRPDGLGIYDLGTFFRTKAPDIVTLPQRFIQAGYAVEGMGKIYHTGHGNSDDELSWSRPTWLPQAMVAGREKISAGNRTELQTTYPRCEGIPVPWAEFALPESDHDDALVATHAIERMTALKDQPFFLAVGFVKPHLPFVAPKKYWDLYDPSQIEIPSSDKPDVEHFAFASWDSINGELRKYYGMPAKGLMPDEDSRKLIQGYYACVSFVDAQVGRLVDALKQLDLYNNTIIVLWGDHGYKLGEYGDWCKHTNFEIDTHIPLIIAGPGIKKDAVTDAMVETVDLYPTLCEFVGLSIPDNLQGSSFLPVLETPSTMWNAVAFNQFPRGLGDGEVMGRSMRTDRYRYTRWSRMSDGTTVGEEVYDHSGPGLEMDNLAAKPENRDLVKKLSARFDREYKKEHRSLNQQNQH
ncbi:sulfatase [Pontiellaceae bacterium B12227]|nr:sulfatase [Pontiellaceae bacterium B12227]